MDPFHYQDNQLFAEDVAVATIAAAHGTPCYIYSRAALESRLQAYEDALAGHDHLTCFAVKANSNLAVLNVLARKGAGFDIVSGGELERVIAAGGDPHKVIFSGLGKTEEEIARALSLGIQCFNIESEPELERIKENQFGIDIERAVAVYERAASLPHIHVIGVDCHIGSQLTSIAPYLDAVDRVLLLVDRLAAMGIHLHHFDMGGGLGVRYNDETPPAPKELIEAILARLEGRKMKLLLEPGRSICANAGIFVTTVEYLKITGHKNFAIVDGAMNDLLRPALYSAWQEIVPVLRRADSSAPQRNYDVVGPVCESGDFLGKDRLLGIQAGDLLAVRSAGAYGFVMSSNYNTRNRAAEIMVDGDRVFVVRQRETLEYQLSLESLLPA